METQLIPLFETILKVRISDLNYGNHLGNSQMIDLIHEARMQWMSSLKMSEICFFEQSLILKEINVIFKNQAFYEDSIKFKVLLGNSRGVSFDLHYELYHQEKKYKIATAMTQMVFYDYQNQKILRANHSFQNWSNQLKSDYAL